MADLFQQKSKSTQGKDCNLASNPKLRVPSGKSVEVNRMSNHPCFAQNHKLQNLSEKVPGNYLQRQCCQHLFGH